MMPSSKLKPVLVRWRAKLAVLLAVSLVVVSGGCFETEEGEPYYGQVRVPRAQEFRWSDGGLPQNFDPALAAAPPDTDAVRALYEGLTDYDPQTLAPVAGVAARWESSADKRAWTFYLRHDARWSDGAPVTAQDFVRSWQRSLRLGERAPHVSLLANIVGATRELPAPPRPSPLSTPPVASPPPPQQDTAQTPNTNAQGIAPRPAGTPEQAQRQSAQPVAPAPVFGAEAVDDYTLRVQLERPDENFPALVAHTVFRPVRLQQETATTDAAAQTAQPQTQATPTALTPPLVSNGAFQLAQLTGEKVSLERAHNYWNAGHVTLERVQFVNLGDTESALAAYHAGEVDAVTNANVEPLAVKLLAPYKDFRRATFGALTYYAFNIARPPFDDLRVRQALALAVDRARLSTDTLEGATEPADTFMPNADPKGALDAPNKSSALQLTYDPERARELLTEAGYPGGAGFPRIRLLVNRNEQHRAVAQAIAGMWRNALGVETEIVLKSWDEYEQAMSRGDYDVARRSFVMQTTDEETNMLAMFALPVATDTQAANAAQAASTSAPVGTSGTEAAGGEQRENHTPAAKLITSEREALQQLPALPVYFASSYALVKPYVRGFDANLLDAPSLQRVRMDTNWQPPAIDTNTSRLIP
jgi:oligopeptide transport system substrate-binding protein